MMPRDVRWKTEEPVLRKMACPSFMRPKDSRDDDATPTQHKTLTPTMKLLPSILLVAVSITAVPIVDARRRAFTSSSLASSISQRRTDQTKQRAAPAFVENDYDGDVAPSSSDTRVTEVRGGGGGTATMSNEMFNMVKAVVGVGVLSLPAGEFR